MMNILRLFKIKKNGFNNETTIESFLYQDINNFFIRINKIKPTKARIITL
jgi:hypothetical protein